MVAEERSQGRLGGKFEATPESVGDGTGLSASERQMGGLHSHEVEQHVELATVIVTEEATLLGEPEVHLTQQGGMATAMRCILGLLTPDSGSMTWGGKPLDAATRLTFGCIA